MPGSKRTRVRTTHLSELLFAKYGGDREKVEAWFHLLAAARRRKLVAEYEIQRGRCAVCEEPTWMHPETGPRSRRATLEHVEPQSSGGTDSRRNLLMTCHDCNMRRGVVDILEFHRNWKETGRRKMPTAPKPPRPAPGPKDLSRRSSTLLGLAILFHLDPSLYGRATALLVSDDAGRREEPG